MAFRFQRRVTLFPGVRLNFGKTGVSVSAGVRGASITAGKRGVYGNVGAPGTGMSYRTRLDKAPAHQRRVARSKAQPQGKLAPQTQSGRVDLKLDERGKLSIYDEHGKPASRHIVQHIWAHHAQDVHTFLESEMTRINDDQDLLVNIHHDTPAADSVPPAFEKHPFNEPKPELADLPRLPLEPVAIAKRWWHAIIPPLERRRHSHNQAQFAAWRHDYAKVEVIIQQREAEYKTRCDAWHTAKKEHDLLQQSLADAFTQDLLHDNDFMAQVLESELAQLDWPRETHIDFDIEGSNVKLDVDFATADEFPSREARFNKSKKRLLISHKSDTQKRKEYARHVHGVLFRCIGVVFATLPSIERLSIAGYTQALNAATGHEEDTYLLAVNVSKTDWQALNLTQPERIDPIAALEQFELNRNMTKTGIFRAVEVT